jgi:mRNA-degrading endonuclease RelE of RelBE toxin-antitoxin system
MKIVLTEEQYNNIVQRNLDEDYPTTWNVEEFSKLKSFNQRIQYCEKNLIRISSGSSRIVYKIDDTKVLKLAKNKKGLAQNEVEISFSNDYIWDSVVAEVFNYDEDNLWLEMELARKVSIGLFKTITGLSFKDYCDGLRYYESQQSRKGSLRYKPDNYDELWEIDFSLEMFTIVGSYDIPVGDLCKLSTYGVVKRDGTNQIVMIDYGLTNEVYHGFYA